MIRDILFVLMVLSITAYAHSNKHEIINFMEVYEEEEEDIFLGDELSLVK